ncbi:hypothetical protein XA68_16065 [Ophiocordyceps unilateralis]|uniref:Peptidyl-prolyl cis-trans isomerase n=1 Tax=Ophiocordyceps unilateralis TaxID=268505 RepID=A0A2A9PKT3_OPHUN|nr:hypothetical protein XA68_16065 [Ophiocordyceps unilateralis]
MRKQRTSGGKGGQRGLRQSFHSAHSVVFHHIPEPSRKPTDNQMLPSHCEKHAKKEEALAKLNEGVKFDEVARTYSEDKARQGGSLGWKNKGSLDPQFEEVAFALEPSTTASPKIGEVKTGFGYHIIMVEGRK